MKSQFRVRVHRLVLMMVAGYVDHRYKGSQPFRRCDYIKGVDGTANMCQSLGLCQGISETVALYLRSTRVANETNSAVGFSVPNHSSHA